MGFNLKHMMDTSTDYGRKWFRKLSVVNACGIQNKARNGYVKDYFYYFMEWKTGNF